MVAASRAQVWAFVRDMDNWAPFLTGYQQHTKLDEQESEWHLKGELGGLTRIAQFKVKILSWNEPDDVTFELAGINEPVTGTGEFAVSMARVESNDLTKPITPAPGKMRRLADRFWRMLVDRIFNAQRKIAPAQAVDPRASETTLRFSVTVTARGMSGPILNVLIAPMLKPVAEDLANKIAAAISALQTRAA